MFVYAFLFLSIYYIGYCIYNRLKQSTNIDSENKYVLITGCDSGFGYLLAQELDKEGFNVLAGVLNQSNVDSLKSQLSKRAKVFPLDITKQNDIDSAYLTVKRHTDVLHALVNNAGIGKYGFVDWVSIETYRQIMDVNFFGQVAMVKTFLPLLTAKAESRVVNVCSVMGFTSPPGMSAYCASKHAFESFSDCLRREMKPWNLHVSIIEPGWLRTPIIRGHDKQLRTLWNGLSFEVKDRWGDAFANETIEKTVKENICVRYAEDPIKVVRAMKHAVSSTEPRIRYQPDLQSLFIFLPSWFLPTWITDKLLQLVTKTESIPTGVQQQIE